MKGFAQVKRRTIMGGIPILAGFDTKSKAQSSRPRGRLVHWIYPL